ncbi:MAG: hydantoinase/oxoprolinase family protein [Haloplanus sp.]
MSGDRFTVGVDIGGTHTDLVVQDGDLARFKVPTTPDSLVDGVLDALERAAAHHDRDVAAFLADTGLVVHGTTVTTNALIEGEAATTGLLTTDGFRDVLERNMESSSNVYDLRREPSLALVPRYLRRGVPERIDSDGTVLEPLDVDAADGVVDDLVAEGASAVAVALMSAYAEDAHERTLAERVAEREDVAAVSASTDVYRTVGLYDRSVAALVDASLKPVVREYLETVESELRAAGFEGTLLLMQGNGGVTSAAVIADQPITSVNSGPAAGAVSAAYHAEQAGVSRVISFEMGGTSSDVCLVPEGDPLVSTDNLVGETPIPVPMVDVNTIGAGGGSVAWVDDRGVLQVGPTSAGSDPGPACYGRGGDDPTVTDANLALGYLNPDYFLGGAMALDGEAAREAIANGIADPLGVSVEEAAVGVRRVANEDIVNQIRQVSIERGYDPREFVLVAGGGAGPVHAATVAGRFDATAIVPRAAGTFSSLGLLEADVRHEFSRSVLEPVSPGALETARSRFGEMERAARETLAGEGADGSMHAYQWQLETRYDGQVHELTIPVESDDDAAAVERRHHDHHAERYDFADESATVEAVTARLTAYARTDGLSEASVDERVPAPEALKTRRSVHFTETEERVETPIYDGSRPIESIEGPGIVEFEHTTLPIPPGFEARTDPYGNYVLDPGT